MNITKKANPDILQVTDVEILEPTAGALIASERICGKPSGFDFLAAALSQVGTFDGKKLPPEDVARLSSSDFLTLVDESGIVDTTKLPSLLSTLPGKDVSGSPE